MTSNGIRNLNIEKINTSAVTTARLAAPEALANQPLGRVNRLWCAACARLALMITPEEAVELARKSCENVVTNFNLLKNAHSLKTSEGATLVCYDSLFPDLF